jgi:hypothetical protein
VVFGGHIEVLIDLTRLTKFQFQHPLLGSIADADDAAGLYRKSLDSLRPSGLIFHLDAEQGSEGTRGFRG